MDPVAGGCESTSKVRSSGTEQIGAAPKRHLLLRTQTCGVSRSSEDAKNSMHIPPHMQLGGVARAAKIHYIFAAVDST